MNCVWFGGLWEQLDTYWGQLLVLDGLHGWMVDLGIDLSAIS